MFRILIVLLFALFSLQCLGSDIEVDRRDCLHGQSKKLRGLACHLVALKEFNDRNNKSEYLKYLGMACNEDYSKSCFALGLEYKVGKIVTQDYNTAKKYLGKACDLGIAKACIKMSFLYDKNPKQREIYEEKACNLGIGLACHVTALEYQRKELDEKELNNNTKQALKYRKKALMFFKKACNLKVNDACKELKKLK